MLRTVNQSLSNIEIKALKLEKLFYLERYIPHYFEGEMVCKERLIVYWYLKFVKLNQINKSSLTLFKNIACFGH